MTLILEGEEFTDVASEQIERGVRAVGAGDVTFAILTTDADFPYVQATRDKVGEPFVLEYREAKDSPQHQALNAPEDDVVDAFVRFARGDRSRSESLRWGIAEGTAPGRSGCLGTVALLVLAGSTLAMAV